MTQPQPIPDPASQEPLTPIVGYSQASTSRLQKSFPTNSLITWCMFWFLGIILLLLFVTESGNEALLKLAEGISRATHIPTSLIIILGAPTLLAFSILVPVATALSLRRTRQARANTILAYVEQGVRLGFPLDRFLLAAAMGEKRKIASRLEKFVTVYGGGQPVGVALAASTPEIAPRVLGIITAGEKAGQLKEVLHEQVSTRQRNLQSQSQIDHYVFSRFYPVFLTFMFLYAVIGINVFVMPKFREIFRDFRMTPSHASWVNSLDFDRSPLTLILFLASLFATFILIVTPRVIETLFPGERKILPLGRFFAYVAWHVPPFRQLSQSRNFADLFGALSISFTAGRDIPDALRESSNIPLNDSLSDELNKAAIGISAGRPVADAFSEAGFSKRVSKLLGTGAAAGKLAETCRFLADIYLAKFSRASIMIRNSYETLLTLVLAYFVATLPISVVNFMVDILGGTMWGVDDKP
jgi:type II secretory pathway component PulF